MSRLFQRNKQFASDLFEGKTSRPAFHYTPPLVLPGRGDAGGQSPVVTVRQPSLLKRDSGPDSGWLIRAWVLQGSGWGCGTSGARAAPRFLNFSR
jgi:hypothetical protein